LPRPNTAGATSSPADLKGKLLATSLSIVQLVSTAQALEGPNNAGSPLGSHSCTTACIAAGDRYYQRLYITGLSGVIDTHCAAMIALVKADAFEPRPRPNPRCECR